MSAFAPANNQESDSDVPEETNQDSDSDIPPDIPFLKKSSFFKSGRRKSISSLKPQFKEVTIRLYDTTIGQGVPNDSGPAIGLDWNWQQHGEIVLTVDQLEDLRGGNLPEDEAEMEDEEWDENWRVPREYYQIDCRLSSEQRKDLLVSAGVSHREISEHTQHMKLTQQSRRRHSRSLIGLQLMNGLLSPDDAHQKDMEVDAARKIVQWLLQRKAKKKRRHSARF